MQLNNCSIGNKENLLTPQILNSATLLEKKHRFLKFRMFLDLPLEELGAKINWTKLY